jgi:hypothetical protein
MEELVFEEEVGDSSAFRITLGDLFVLIKWMNQSKTSLDRGEDLPPSPDLDSGKVKGWIQLVQRLEERIRRNEEKKLALEANVMAHDAQMGQILSHMHANLASLYDSLGQAQRAKDVRRRAEAVHGG